jgi:hypothetical protein
VPLADSAVSVGRVAESAHTRALPDPVLDPVIIDALPPAIIRRHRWAAMRRAVEDVLLDAVHGA